MNTSKNLPIIISTVLVLATLSSPAHARFKCWTNKEGIKECGESVPPEYAQQGHQELSKGGIVVDRQERAKTTEELEEEARLAAVAAEAQRAKEEQAAQDKILLDTFTSIEDIEAVRDDKLAVIESSITLTNKRNEKTQEDLDKRIQAAAAEERAGKTPNAALLKDIEVLRARMAKNEAFIADKREEQNGVNADAEADIERFKRLKGL